MKQTILPIGPIDGVRDVGASGAQDPKFLQDLINGYLPAPRLKGPVWARPGFARNSSTTLATNNGYVQCICSTQGVSPRVFAVVDGHVWRQTGTTSWVDVTPVGITISSTNRVHATEFNGELIFTDRANKPWRASNLTGTPITGTVIEINSSSHAWGSRGPAVVRAGKLVFVVDAINGTTYETRTAWCEEADAATGYMQTGYTNYWDVAQNESGRLWSLAADDNAIYYLRASSIGSIRGTINADFTTSSTHDDVSTGVGTFVQNSNNGTPAPIVARDYIWFFNSDCLPCRFRSGSKTIEPLWQQMRNRVELLRAHFADVGSSVIHQYPTMTYLADLDKVVMMFLSDPSTSSSAESQDLYVFDASSGSYEGRWQIEADTQADVQTYPSSVRAMMIADVPILSGLTNSPQRSLMVAGSRPGAPNTGGHVWRQTLLKQRTVGDNAAAMHMSATTMLEPNDENVEYKVDEVVLEVLPDTTAVSLDYYTPRGSTLGLSATGVASNDSIQTSYDHGICRFGLGAKASGRWFRAVFYKNVPAGTTPHAFEKGSIKVRVLPLSPFAP